MSADTRTEHVWMTAQEVADYLRVSLGTVHRHCAAETMRSVQSVPNGRRFIRREWADDWGEARPSLPAKLRSA